MEIDIIGVPLDFGSGRRGVDLGPAPSATPTCSACTGARRHSTSSIRIQGETMIRFSGAGCLLSILLSIILTIALNMCIRMM
jgi:hypothetical protein